jgi:hypothetical protein
MLSAFGILKPYLCRREVDETGEVLPLGGGQVLLLLEPSLQLVHLHSKTHVITTRLKSAGSTSP